MKKRVFALLLCLLLCLSILPVGAFADDYCEHDIVKMDAKATCGEAHREHYKCTKCGKLFSDDRGEHEISYADVAQEKLPHTSELKHVDFDDASCTESGNYEYWVCTECGQMFSENPGFEGETDNRRTKPVPDDKVKDYTIEPYGHNLVFHDAVPHTCTQDGTVAYYQCTSCGLCFSDPDGLNPLSSVTDPAAHVKTEYPAVAPTCDTDGRSYYFYCDVCGKYYDENGQEIAEGSWVIPAGHNYVEQPFHEPTCTAAGNRLYYTCSACGKIFDADLNETTLEAVTLNMIPHSLVIHVPAVAKSCYTDGNVEYWQCASCGAKFADAEGTLPLTDEEVVIPACHEFVATPAKEPTCTEPGNIAYWTCTVEGCGIVVDESGNQVWETTVPAAGHKPVKVERTTTCTEAGIAEHYKCEVCGRLFQDEACTVETTLDQLQEAALGHEFDWEGWCTRCKAVSPDAPAFNPGPVTVPNNDNTYVVVTVTAPEGVFPANCQLSVQPVFVVDDQTKEAVDAERQEGKTVAKSFTYDIKVLKNGEEIQPADGSKVKVSFALATAANTNLDATVYHVTDDGAKALETSVEGETVSAETDGFSLYTVEFTYQELQYVLLGGEIAPLATILNTLGLSGEVQNVSVSNPALFEAKDEAGEWIVYSYEPFQTDEWMKVILDGIEYTIKVTDDATDTTTYKLTYDARPGTITIRDTQGKDHTGPTVTVSKKENDKARNYKPNELEGYTFDTWCSDEARTIPFNFSTPITKNMTLYAKWLPDFSIISGDGGTAYSGYDYEFILNNKNDNSFVVYVAKEGSEFGAPLTKDKDYTVTPGTDKHVSVKLLGDYVKSLDETTYKIRFDTGLEKPGYSDGTFNVSKDPAILCKVIYLNKVDGATPWPADTTVPQGTVLEEVKPIATGYRFDGWFDAATGGNAYTFPLTINADKTFYAHWTSLYDVTFIDMLQSYNIFRPTPNPIVDVPYGTVISRPDNEKDKKMSVLGYSFEGWYTGLKSSTPYNFSEGITGDTDIYAHWNSDLQILQQGYKYEKGSGTPSSKAYSNHNYYFLVNCNWKQVSVDNDNYKVYIDGAKLDRNHYNLVNKEGVGTFVVLKNTFIKNNLSEGRHTFIFDTGIDPNNEFGIYLGSVEGTFDYSKAPKTGDESNVALWAAIAGVSLIAVVVIAAVLLNKRKKGKKAPTPPENRPADKTKKPPKE